MANLKALFSQAKERLSGTSIRRTATQEVLELQDIQQGFAWRPLSGTNILQIYPPTRESKWLRDGPFLVIRSKKSEWLNILVSSLQGVPKNLKGMAANNKLDGELKKHNLHSNKELTKTLFSGHEVDFVIEYDEDKIGLEFGTGQAERVELDLLKLINLALNGKITYACLVLPRDIIRHNIMGAQQMRIAVTNLFSMCSPLLYLLRTH